MTIPVPPGMKNLSLLLRRNRYFYLGIFFIFFVFFYPLFLQGKIPIPADTIVGLYHPWRDVIWNKYTAGVPFKNFLITDPVRQQYVWRKLAFDEIKKGNIPYWNPYSFAGMPLLANIQSAVLYPLNILFFLLPFPFAWGILVFLQPVLASVFLFTYLRLIGLSRAGSFLGAVSFSLSGVFVAWLEWNTVLHTLLWLPYCLFLCEKLSRSWDRKTALLLSFAFLLSFFAGHLQLFFYVLLTVLGYIFFRKKNSFRYVSSIVLLFLFLSLIQSIPTAQLILASGRSTDQGNVTTAAGWFIPFAHAIQFFAPDFFGNPATNNYFGVWNYGEFIGYIGVVPFMLALYGMFSASKKRYPVAPFFIGLFLIGILFAFPTPLAKLPFILNIPFLSTSQPTRLLSLIVFSLAVFSAIGFDEFFFQIPRRKIHYIIGGMMCIGIGLWVFASFGSLPDIPTDVDWHSIARRNLVLPSVFFLVASAIFFLVTTIQKFKKIGAITLLILTLFDLFRFGWKFTPFTSPDWIFPQTKLITFLQEQSAYWRVMALDRRIFPPNFSAFYRLQDVAGYDPIYLRSYAHIVAAWERDASDLTPAAFHRILTPSNVDSFFPDLLGVKYILSFGPIQSEKLVYVASEGETHLYENRNVFPRAFFVEDVVVAKHNQDALEKMFTLNQNLRYTAVALKDLALIPKPIQPEEYVTIVSYEATKIEIKTRAITDRLLVLSDIYYPAWNVSIDNTLRELLPIDFALRGVVVPTGEHTVVFRSKFL